MRIIRIDEAQPGMRLGSDLCHGGKNILLKRGVVLTEAMIQSVIRRGFNSLYIEDGFGDPNSLKEAEIVPESKRQIVVGVVKEFFEDNLKADSFSRSSGVDASNVYQAAKEMVRIICENPQVSLSLVDLKSFDDYTFQHSVSVCILVVVLGKYMKLPLRNLEDLAVGALLHDLGKLAIPKEILSKPGKLDLAEMDVIRTHPRLGFELLSNCTTVTAQAKAFVLQHHEYFNGSGYPKGLAADDIHVNARLGALVDVYDALVSDRPYRLRFHPHQALALIKEGSGTHFDPILVEHFLRIVSPYPLGSRLLLSTGEQVSVVKVPAGHVTQPLVQIVADARGVTPDEAAFLDLASTPERRIVKVLD